MILLFFIIMVLISLEAVVLLRKRTNGGTVGKINTNSISPTVIKPNTGTAAITGVILNKNNYPVHLIDGKINKISDEDPVKWEVTIGLGKIFPDQNGKDVVKTIIIKNNVELVLHDLKTNKDIETKLSSYKVGDNVTVWTVELNSDILKLSQFTATKIIKFQ